MNNESIITLDPVRTSAGVVWADRSEVEPPAQPPLEQSTVAVGPQLVGTEPNGAPLGLDVKIGPHGTIGLLADCDAPAVPLSTIPRERMAAGWHEIFDQVRDFENGTGPELAVQPGGGIAVKREGRDDQPVSVIPSVVMAAGITSADAVELSALDPDNSENWTPVSANDGSFSGWLFELAPPFQDYRFRFLTFRNPSRRNLWDIASIVPNLDTEFGHTPHVIRTTVGGQRMPILCGPGGEPSPTLTDARGVAAKWMYYTSARMAGVNPGFSL